MDQLHFDSSISELRYLASRTIFNDSPLVKMITGLTKVLTFGCSSLFTGDIISYSSKMSSILFTLPSKGIRTLLALCFLKTASGFKGKCSGERWCKGKCSGELFQHRNLMLHKLLDILIIVRLICRIRFVLFENVEK